MPFTVEETDTDATPLVGACLLRGWSFLETTGTDTAEVDIYDGDVGADLLVAAISLSAGESTRDYPPGAGIMIRTFAFVYVVSGSVRGSLWLTPISHADDVEWVFGERGPYFDRPGT